MSRNEIGKVNDMINVETAAPTGRPMPAQGNALGKAEREAIALKGRPTGTWDVGVALSGLETFPRPTQGVALGWHGSGRWPASSRVRLLVSISANHETPRHENEADHQSQGCHGTIRETGEGGEAEDVVSEQ